jgi:hypothetical protein
MPNAIYPYLIPTQWFFKLDQVSPTTNKPTPTQNQATLYMSSSAVPKCILVKSKNEQAILLELFNSDAIVGYFTYIGR